MKTVKQEIGGKKKEGVEKIMIFFLRIAFDNEL